MDVVIEEKDCYWNDFLCKCDNMDSSKKVKLKKQGIYLNMVAKYDFELVKHD